MKAFLTLLSALLLFVCLPERSAAGAGAVPSQIEADWLRQLAVRDVPTSSGAVTREEDAAGGCDGVKNGLWGFHTGREERPWWQVDLGREMPLERVLVYNRCDGATERASRLELCLSCDGSSWSVAYRHDGSGFRGVPDGKPLAIGLKGARARFVRVELPGTEFLHLDEVEVYPAPGPGDQNPENVALGKPANQSSVSPWSKWGAAVSAEDPFPRDAASARRILEQGVERGRKLAASLRGLGAGVDGDVAALEEAAAALKDLAPDALRDAQRGLYLKARRAIRSMAFKNPLLDFDSILFAKRVPTSFTHMSDQYYGWFSRPGGGLYLLEGLKGGSGSPARVRPLTEGMPPGNVVDPELSPDGRKVLFAHATFHPGLADEPNKLDKSRVPEDAFYHLYEMNLDGTGLRRLTRGKYDDFDGRYLPGGGIVFLSTRRGKSVQCGKSTGLLASAGEQPDSYVRCGGGPERPVAVYTLHVMGPGGEDIRPISPFESFEWMPSITTDGRILYARWDYVDRDNMPYISLWSCLPDGTGVEAVFGNHTVSPYSIFEAQSIPGSRKLVFTASAHHSITGGSLVLLDPSRGTDGPGPMTRLTPEVPFPEVEAWPSTYFVNPVPLSEEFYLVAWSDRPLVPGWPQVNPSNALGIYLLDAFGNLELIHRDPEMSSMNPVPVRQRRQPAELASSVRWDGDQEGRVVVLDVEDGLEGVAPGSVSRLRIVGVPAKTHPTMNFPSIGITHDDPGKFVLGTVPVDADGSAYFRVPSGVPFFVQALDAGGMALQTMRSVTYVQPGETRACTGCHQGRNVSPRSGQPLATRREPSRLTPGPEGSWPLDFRVLVGPVIARRCEGCHKPGAAGAGAAIDLTPEKSYETLVSFGGGSQRAQVLASYRLGRSTSGLSMARGSPILDLLRRGHHDVTLEAAEVERLVTWMDMYSQRLGSFGAEQEAELRDLRGRVAALLER